METLDQADSVLMIAEVKLEDFVTVTKDWIVLFETELKRRETN